MLIERGKIVFSRNGIEWGITTGGKSRPCFDECPGKRIGVRWPDGELTYVCTDSFAVRDDGAYQLR